MKEGDAVGPYALETPLGRGFTGSTWIARPTAGGGRVVLKVIDLQEAAGWTGVDLLRREAEALRTLSHPGLPRCIEYFEETTEGHAFLVLVTELVEGSNLQTFVEGGRRFDDAEIASILAGLASILAYLGSLRPPVVHRDVNPKNVLLRPDGSVALVDFSGVQEALRAAASPGATLVGTAGYTPFEQVAGKASPRSDLYGAAATALFLLARRNPAELPAKGLKPDLSAFPGLSARLAFVLDAWLEPDQALRDLDAVEAAAILKGEAPLPGSARLPAASLGGGAPEERKPRSRRAEPAATLPSDSRVRIESGPKRLRILIPPAGLRSGSANLVGGAFALFWLAFVAFWTFMTIAMKAPFFFTLFSLPFWAVGVFMVRAFLKGIFISTELLLDRIDGMRYVERAIGPGKRTVRPLSDAGRCAIENSALQVKGSKERELVLDAGAAKLRLGRGLSDRELAAMRDAVNGWLAEAAQASR